MPSTYQNVSLDLLLDPLRNPFLDPLWIPLDRKYATENHVIVILFRRIFLLLTFFGNSAFDTLYFLKKDQSLSAWH